MRPEADARRQRIDTIKAATTRLQLNLTRLDWDAYLTMLSLELPPQTTIGEVKAALHEMIAEREAAP